MAGIFTRRSLSEIMSNENLTPEERTDQIFSLWGRALDDGYVTKGAAKAAQESALEAAKAEWEKGVTPPDPTQSDAYKALQAQFDQYKAKQTAMASEDFAEVKPKFAGQVYDMLDYSEGAKPVKEQMSAIREKYEEYFTPAQDQKKPPVFGAPTEGSMPKGDKGAVAAFSDAWGYAPRK